MGYDPNENVPLDADPELTAYIAQELRAIANAFAGVDRVRLVELHVEPDRPRDGDIVLADGVNWNPGSGAGYYGYQSAAWTFLG